MPTFAALAVPGLATIPVLGRALFAQPAPTYGLYLLVPLAWWWLYRTHGGLALRATRAGHVAQGSAPQVRLIDVGGEAAPNGNTVSLEDELVRGAGVKRQHELALSVYQSGLRLMRTAAGRRG